ncbi:sulfotransferase family cytosolic 1B member 1-like [Anneissia japonica]|uniref:sulfotransferase family cytosolic 1B member 1-like n=1 Tax=Anneissia japonica TaxID=1529436 RepID=UPI0014258C70|nr:sulfotransferase family cytosolic 1B member 1-like [Anneissia japonica]
MDKLEHIGTWNYGDTELPRIVKKEILEGEVIYVARNPKDNAVSMYHFVLPVMKSVGVDFPWEAFLEMYSLGKQPFGSWASHVVPFWEHRNDSNFLFLKYEDMKADHTEAVRKIATHLGYSTSEDVIRKTVENSTAERTKDALKLIPEPDLPAILGVGDFVRKGVVGDWKSHFTVAQNEAFDAAIKKDLDGTGLTMDY